MDWGKFFGEVFTTVFVARTAIGTVIAGFTAWGVSFLVADYVAKASITGLSTAVEGLQSGVSTLNSSIQQVNTNILTESRAWRTDRDQIAKDIAQQVAALQKDQRDSDGSMAELAKQLAVTNSQLGQLNGSINNLSNTVKGVDDRLSASVTRQTDFEKLVTSILLRQGPPPLKQNWYEPWGLKSLPHGLNVQFLETDPKALEGYVIKYGITK